MRVSSRTLPQQAGTVARRMSLWQRPSLGSCACVATRTWRSSRTGADLQVGFLAGPASTGRGTRQLVGDVTVAVAPTGVGGVDHDDENLHDLGGSGRGLACRVDQAAIHFGLRRAHVAASSGAPTRRSVRRAQVRAFPSRAPCEAGLTAIVSIEISASGSGRALTAGVERAGRGVGYAAACAVSIRCGGAGVSQNREST